MILEQYPEIQGLSVLEKLRLVEELWDDLEQHADDLPVTDTFIAELDSRVALFKLDPRQGSSWQEVHARILASRKTR
jgi:putative addiction module component (TIGR02574 family)